MSEIVTISGKDEPTVVARYQIEKAARPTMSARVLRRDVFEACSLRVVPDPVVSGGDGDCFRGDGQDVYVMTVEFS